jgi:hypothetical protein
LSRQRAQIDEDAASLAQMVEKIESEAEALRRERVTASARLAAARAVSQLEGGERIDQMIALDRARDEVERAHALAQLCREDLGRKG